MEDVCRRPRPIGEVDVDAIVDRMSNALTLERIPRKPRPIRPSRLVVVFDRAARLIPFWGDQREMYLQLRDELGAEGLERRWWHDGPPVAASDEALVQAVHPQLEAGDAVLVLGDLGHYAPKLPQDRVSVASTAYARLGEALRRHGVTAAALLPVPASRWEPEIVRAWRAIDWAQPTRRATNAGPLDAEALVRRRNQLLALVSWTQRLEPGLLREARLCLPPEEADVGTEADVWCYEPARLHEGLEGAAGRGEREVVSDESVYQDVAGLVLPDAVRRAWHPELRRLLSTRASLVRRVVGCVRRRHATFARELWLDEVRGLASLDQANGAIACVGDEGVTAEERAEAYDFTLKLRAYFDPRRNREALNGVDLQGWLAMFLDGQPAEAWQHGEWGEILGETWMLLGLDDRPVPAGLDLSRIRRFSEGAEELRFVVAQVGDAIHVGVEGGEIEGRGSPLVTVAMRAQWITVNGRYFSLDREHVLELPLSLGEEIELATDRMAKVRLRLEGKPGWAQEVRRDRKGVHVRGPQWAVAHGEDEFGVWATFRVGEVEQRMRWIAPGMFMMGSPEGEEGRWDDEGPQHEVTLTEGYWVADTPCTQALWVAVVGGNPSRFQSQRRPVEQVSWDDVQRFLAELNERVLGLEAGLPTEAQWEYACRAGTTTATYAGDLRIRGENDAPRLDDIAWYGGNSGVGYELANGADSSRWPNKQYPHTRAGTREVGLKGPNQWGVYDTLGNVFEWCADMGRRYDGQRVTDPVGTKANALGPKRVLRGGGWLGLAQYCRAAHRYWLDLGSHYGNVGFRLSRGQGLRQEASPANQQQGRGTSPASPGVRGRKSRGVRGRKRI